MISIEDWEEKLDKKPAKNRDTHIQKDILNPLIRLCKLGIVLKFMQRGGFRDEKKPYWLTPDTVATYIGANSAYVAIVFGKLEKEGFLFPLESYPINEIAYINGMTLMFKNGKWKEKRKGHFSSKIESSTTWRSRITIKKQWISKIDYIDSNWDGKARRLNIDSKSFVNACMELNYHPKMNQPWKCPCCKQNNDSSRQVCFMCNIPRVISELEKYKLSKSKKQNICKLCGMPMRTHNRNQTEHTKEACIKRIFKIIHDV